MCPHSVSKGPSNQRVQPRQGVPCPRAGGSAAAPPPASGGRACVAGELRHRAPFPGRTWVMIQGQVSRVLNSLLVTGDDCSLKVCKLFCSPWRQHGKGSQTWAWVRLTQEDVCTTNSMLAIGPRASQIPCGICGKLGGCLRLASHAVAPLPRHQRDENHAGFLLPSQPL